MERPLLRQFSDLSPSDFEEHPVWVGCHVADHDEPWYDDTDEETFRPSKDPTPVGVDASYLVKATATASDGTTIPGFVTPTTNPDDLGLAQPHIFIGGEPFGFWWGVMRAPEEEILRGRTSLARPDSEVFPLVFSPAAGLASGAQRYIIDRWEYSSRR